MKYYSEETVKGLLEQLDSYFVKYLENLPSIEIKEPHGRCIDADAFKLYLMQSCLKHIGHPNYAEAKRITEEFCRDIDEQPTVIEAST